MAITKMLLGIWELSGLSSTVKHSDLKQTYGSDSRKQAHFYQQKSNQHSKMIQKVLILC